MKKIKFSAGWVALMWVTPAILGNAPIDPRLERARTILEDNLLDYQSARLRNFHHTKSQHGEAICGEMNAPNKMGGMTGWKRTGIILSYTSSSGRPAETNLSTVPGSTLGEELPYWSICDAGATGGITVDPTDVTPFLLPRE